MFHIRGGGGGVQPDLFVKLVFEIAVSQYFRKGVKLNFALNLLLLFLIKARKTSEFGRQFFFETYIKNKCKIFYRKILKNVKALRF